MTETNGGTPKFRIHGRVRHGRTLSSIYGKGSQHVGWLRQHVDPNAEAVYTRGKHKYLYPLDAEMGKRVESLRQPYPKRADEAI